MTYEPVKAWELVRFRGPRKGVQALHDVIVVMYHAFGATSGGIYNRRSVRGGTSWSLHAVGRAFDIMVPTALGDVLFTRLISVADKLGICEIIWNRRRWTPEHGVQVYNGVNPHTDHLHVGMTTAVADSDHTRDELVAWDTAVLQAANAT